MNVPDVTPEEEARLHLRAAAEVLHGEAAAAHAKGMYYERQSARLEQLAELALDNQVLRCRDMFVDEGVIEIETHDGPQVSSPGGES